MWAKSVRYVYVFSAPYKLLLKPGGRVAGLVSIKNDKEYNIDDIGKNVTGGNGQEFQGTATTILKKYSLLAVCLLGVDLAKN